MQEPQLNNEELGKLDELVSSARRFHYLAFSVAGLSLALSSLEKVPSVTLPIGNVELPSTESSVALYLLVITFTIVADRLLDRARPWLRLDPRRPPSAWLALGSRENPTQLATIWLMIPLIACCIATGLTLDGDLAGWFLSFVGVLIALTPRNVSEYWTLIRERRDKRGGTATLSILLLYAYRIVRGIGTTAWFITPVLATPEPWREPMTKVFLNAAWFLAPMYVVRFISGFRGVYKRIDALGPRYGLPSTSIHYR